MRCTICREKLPHNTPRWWRQSHYQSLHADYARSIGRWYRNFFALLGPFLLALILTEYLWFSYGGFYVVIAGVTILLFIAFCIYDLDAVRGQPRFSPPSEINTGNNPRPRSVVVIEINPLVSPQLRLRL